MKYDVWFVNWMGYELMGSFESEEAAQNWIDYESEMIDEEEEYQITAHGEEPSWRC